MSFDVRLTKLILDNYKNMSEFIEETSLSRTLVDSYAKGRTIPSIKKVEEFAKLFNVSAAWLAYGVDMKISDELVVVDTVNLIHIRIEKWLDESDKEMNSDKKAELAKLIYKKLKEDGEISINKIETIISILSAA